MATVLNTQTDDLGTDITLVSGDLAPVWGLSSGQANLLAAILRRLTTPRGALFYDQDYGLDIMSYLNAALTPTDLATLRGAIVAELRKDPRILSMTVDLSFPGVS